MRNFSLMRQIGEMEENFLSLYMKINFSFVFSVRGNSLSDFVSFSISHFFIFSHTLQIKKLFLSHHIIRKDCIPGSLDKYFFWGLA